MDLPFLKKTSGKPAASAAQKPSAQPPSPATQPPPQKPAQKQAAQKPAQKLPSPLQLLRAPSEIEELKLKIELYRAILSRYESFIEESESKSVSDLKGLVRPYDHSVTEAKISILDMLHPYNPEEHFIQAADAAIARISKVHTVELPINFWLGFEQMDSIGAADEMDKAIYLCSILRSLECQNARVLITDSKKPYVLFEHKGVFHLANTTSATRVYGTKEQVMATLGADKPRYSFSDSAYEEYGQEGG